MSDQSSGYLTLFADASHCLETNSSGWGAWAKRSEWYSGRLMGGQFKIKMDNIGNAELCALVKATGILFKANDLEGIDTIMMQSDSLRALSVLYGYIPGASVSNHKDGAKVAKLKGQRTKIEVRACEILEEMMLAAKFKVVVRHVKGHKAGERRQWVNRQCDLIAGKNMRSARESARKNRKKLPAEQPTS